MPVSAAITGQGSTFSIGNATGGSSTVYTPIAMEVLSIKPPTYQRETEDATHLQSPGDHREHIPALVAGQESTISFNHVPDASDPLYANFIAGLGDYQLTWPNGVKLQFSGVPTGWSPGDATSGKLTAEYTILPSGVPTLA